MDGKGQIPRIALNLVRGCGTDGGIEGDIGRFAVGWPSLDVTSPFAIGARLAAATALAARQFVQVGIKPPLNFELSSRLCLLAAFPPARRIIVLKLRLARQFLWSRFRGFLLSGIVI